VTGPSQSLDHYFFVFSVLIGPELFENISRHLLLLSTYPGDPNPPHTPTPSTPPRQRMTGEGGAAWRVSRAVNCNKNRAAVCEGNRHRQPPAVGTAAGELGEATAGEQCTVGRP